MAALNGNRAVAPPSSSLDRQAGEIVGIAGVSGNGQRELVEVLAGQRDAQSGGVRVGGAPLSRHARASMRRHRVFAADGGAARQRVRARHVGGGQPRVPATSTSRRLARGGFLVKPASDLRQFAQALIARYRIRAGRAGRARWRRSRAATSSARCSRASSPPRCGAVVQNPCFGLDVAAAAEIRAPDHAPRATAARPCC